MKITVLCENTTSNENLSFEHGLSLYIETQSHKILFDMGQSDIFSENAKKLDIDLSKVDIAVLSHGHYDHGGGLRKFLEINNKAKVYLSKFAFEPHYNGEKYIGLDTKLQDSDRLVFVNDEFTIADGLTLFSCNAESKNWEFDCGGLSVLCNGEKTDDPFLHEHYLLIEENEHRVLVSGCSHKGISNIVPAFDVDTIIGGFHTSKWSDEDVRNLSETLGATKRTFYTCHCTGIRQYELMKQNMSKLSYISTSDSFELHKNSHL